jgi:hypothetical protein
VEIATLHGTLDDRYYMENPHYLTIVGVPPEESPDTLELPLEEYLQHVIKESGDDVEYEVLRKSGIALAVMYTTSSGVDLRSCFNHPPRHNSEAGCSLLMNLVLREIDGIEVDFLDDKPAIELPWDCLARDNFDHSGYSIILYRTEMPGLISWVPVETLEDVDRDAKRLVIKPLGANRLITVHNLALITRIGQIVPMQASTLTCLKKSNGSLIMSMQSFRLPTVEIDSTQGSPQLGSVGL